MQSSAHGRTERIVGRYVLGDPMASGGMATVHLGRLLGPAGFTRTVAIKRLHEQYARDPEFVSMFLDEARLAARIRHPNVVPTLDVVAAEGELFLVMEYVHGESLSRLVRQLASANEQPPPAHVIAIMAGVLHGLHAAHEAKSERGLPLGIVHRDVSPQNVLVGADGIARVVDFGVAKAAGRVQTTREGQLKGKVSYMAPEQVLGNPTTRQCDVFAAAAVLWEALTCRRLFQADTEGGTLGCVLQATIDPPSTYAPRVSPELDAIVLRGLERDPRRRFADARQMAAALERAVPPSSASELGAWVESLAAPALCNRMGRVSLLEGADFEDAGAGSTPVPVSPPRHSPPLLAATSADISTVITSRPAPASASTRVSLGWLVAIGAASAGIALLAARLVRGPEGTQRLASSPTSDASATAPIASSRPASPSGEPIAATTAPPSPPGIIAAPPGSAGGAVGPPAPPRLRPASCDPPYKTDASGVRHLKPWCLSR